MRPLSLIFLKKTRNYKMICYNFRNSVVIVINVFALILIDYNYCNFKLKPQ